jgi:hypothetical protein
VASDRPTDLPERADVAAVAVDQHDPIPAVGGETGDDLADVLPKRVGRDPERAGELPVLLGDSDRNRGRDHHLAVVDVLVALRARRRDRARSEAVGAERGVRAVLFGAADREHCEVGLGRVGVGPRRLGEVHTRTNAAGGLYCRRAIVRNRP